MDVLVDLLSVDLEGGGGAGGAAQRGVEHRAVLGGVDVGAGEHGVAVRLHADLTGELLQELEGLGGHEVLGQVDVEVRGVGAEALRTLGVRVEPFAQ